MATVEAKTGNEAVQPGALSGRVALVTGGTRGIGAAISRNLGLAGATVAAGYNTNREQADVFLAELAALGADATAHAGNVADADECRRTVAEVIEQHGRLDMLVNNAGITIDRTVPKMTYDDWATVLAVNLSGSFFAAQAALPHMIERGSGREAAFQLQRAGRLDPFGPNVTVNCVAPGFIATEMVETIPEKVLNRITSQIPLARLGRTDEVARVVHFLCSDESAYITGQVWGINGGMEM
jgi:acetoacetyl-CoA reductase/3-oxoacyl-[acyl-carrier protein] reductase